MADSPEQSRDGMRSSRESWLVIGVLTLALIVIPWSLILLPSARGVVEAVGFTLRDAYLVVPLVPAIGLGVIGVWTAVRARRSS
ncbi:MAG: hypothetical protein ABEJ47_01845 [Halorhabdus sp.]